MQNFSMNFIDSIQTPLANSLACDGNVDLHQCRSPIVVDSANAKQPYFIGFAARPIGAAIFGHYGDRIGRKATLIATLLCMGLATFAIAFVPTFASIGISGAIILTILRAIQGIGVGGEWGGSVLLAMEWSRTHGQRGLVASCAFNSPGRRWSVDSARNFGDAGFPTALR
jgi:MFS family permease